MSKAIGGRGTWKATPPKQDMSVTMAAKLIRSMYDVPDAVSDADLVRAYESQRGDCT